MSLILKFNRNCKSLDLIGPIPVEAKQRVMQVMTYNPNLRCFQGAVNLHVFSLADDLHAIISPEVFDAIEKFTDPVRKGSGGEESPTERSKSTRVEGTGVIGCIVKHSGLGLGRLLNLEGRVAVVNFFFPPSQKQLNPNYLHRSHIPIGTTCETKNGNCIIQERKPSQGHAPHIYRVEFENGLEDELPETVLSPIKLVKPRDPLEVLATLQQEGYPIFKTREVLAQTYNALLRRCVGVKSLLSSRIDLYPHQAYVAGTVILDSKQRYLLADEVGLGKTIEAGIVIHDLLARNPRANILIICPGSLVQQWFTEMYSKFSGVIFRLPELSGINTVMMGQAVQVILSFYAALIHRKALMDKQWDLIVIDEVHNLLRVKPLYELAKKLSLQDRGLLLLSALPAQHRDHEYYDLLALLEPKKYRHNDVQAREHFSMLFERQREIGGRIGVVNRRLTELHEGGSEPDRVIKQLATLIELPVLHDDQFLNTAIAKLDPKSEIFAETVHQVLHHISDYYRINRRILRNRREKLIESEQIERLKRVQNTLFYNPDQYELDAVVSLERFLQSLRQTKLPEKILLPLTKELFHAAVHPKTLLQTLKISEQTLTGASEEKYGELHDLDPIRNGTIK